MNTANITLDLSGIMVQAVDTGLFVSLISFSAPAASDTGAPSGVYTAITGLQNIVCMDAPAPFGSSIGATEMKAELLTSSMAMRHVLLDAYYAQLSPATNWGDVGWRATVDGVIYDVLGAEADSQQIMTRVHLRKVTV